MRNEGAAIVHRTPSSSTPASATSTRVLAYGSNLFNQLHPNSDITAAPSSDSASVTLILIHNAASIHAACTYQTIIRTHEGKLEALGESAHVLNDLFRTTELDDEGVTLVGQDIFELVLDADGSRIWYVDYVGEKSTEADGGRWKSVAADGRGRCMAIDAEGSVYLFGSARSLWAATRNGEEGRKLRQQSRFLPHAWLDSGLGERSTDHLPRFSKVSAGNAHFILLAERCGKHAPVWIFGDARFGAVPLHPFPNTDLVGVLPPSADAPPTDVPYLMPVTHFSKAEGFPSAIADVAAGSRHNLILTEEGDVYGWGWNEDSPLLPFSVATEGVPGLEQNIVSEPTLIDVVGQEEVWVAKVAASNGRSFAVTSEGKLAVAGSNEFHTLGLGADLGGLEMKPHFEREFSQIKKTYDCVNGFHLHPTLEEVVDVHATSLATFITLAS